MDRFGPGKLVVIGFPVMAAGLGIFTLGVARHADYAPTLLAGLLIMGLGVGCVATPLSGGCVQSLAPHQIARATTLLGINDQVGGAIGAALMAVLLTNQLNRHEGMAAANIAHAYTVVFVVAAALAVCTIVPAAFLPRKSAAQPPIA
jgi:MFS family permease